MPCGVGQHPHLHEVDVGSVALAFISEWRMPVPALMRCASRGVITPSVAVAVAVLELAVEHPRDDLHVAVRVRAEAAAGARRRRRC